MFKIVKLEGPLPKIFLYQKLYKTAWLISSILSYILANLCLISVVSICIYFYCFYRIITSFSSVSPVWCREDCLNVIFNNPDEGFGPSGMWEFRGLSSSSMSWILLQVLLVRLWSLLLFASTFRLARISCAAAGWRKGMFRIRCLVLNIL